MINEKKIIKENRRIKKIENLIEYILSLKRKIAKEKYYENPEIKLVKRLEQRSHKELSKEMLFYLIIRYEIDNKKLPSKEELVQIMIDFLGNIQKSPDFYKLSNNKNELLFKTDELIGSGSHATVYSFKLKNNKKR